MKYAAVAIVALIVVATSSVADDKAITAERKRFDGTWQLVSAVKDGKETPEEIVKKVRVVIKDGKHTVHVGEEVAAKDVPFTVDPTTKPNSVDDLLPDGKKILGIYEIDGDKLTSCVAEVGKDRPTKFEAKPGTGHTLRVFKRVKE